MSGDHHDDIEPTPVMSGAPTADPVQEALESGDMSHAVHLLRGEVDAHATKYRELSTSLHPDAGAWTHRRLCTWTKREGRRVRHAHDLRAGELERLRAEVERLTALKSLPSRGHQIAHVLMDFGDAFDGPMEAVWAALPGRARDNVRGAWGRMLAEVDDSELERLTAALAEDQAETRGRVQEVVDWMAVVKLRREEVERLTDRLTQDENDRKECEAGAIERDRMRKEFAATVERLTRERDAAVEGRTIAMTRRLSEWDGLDREVRLELHELAGRREASRSSEQWLIRARERAETAERERDVLRELVRAAQHHIPRSWPQWPAWSKRAFDVLGPEFALSGSGDFEDSTTDANPPKGVDAFFGTLTSDETDEEFLAMVGADGDSTTDETDRPDPEDMHGAGDDFGGSDF